jgi:hypothetical protein
METEVCTKKVKGSQRQFLSPEWRRKDIVREYGIMRGPIR